MNHKEQCLESLGMFVLAIATLGTMYYSIVQI